MTRPGLSRREMLGQMLMASVVLGFGRSLPDRSTQDSDEERLKAWVKRLRDGGLGKTTVPLGRRAIRVGELAQGTPYEAGTLEQYIREGGDPREQEPLTISLTRFDCVTLVESCLAVARVAARYAVPTWEQFGAEVERMRYRGGHRLRYPSRLHYFSEWILDGERRGLVRNMGEALGGVSDSRPLRFMSEHRPAYPALTFNAIFDDIAEMERRLDDSPRWFIPTEKIVKVEKGIQSGDVLAFATDIPGLDVTHAAFAYRGKDGVLRVLHAPLSGGVVEITRSTLPQYVKAIKRATGVMVARPL